MMILLKNKGYLALILLAIAVCTIPSSCQNPPGDNKANMIVQNKSSYSCSMHPEISRDKPGDCPICGMHLVKTEFNPQTANEHQPENLPELPTEFATAGIPLIAMTNEGKDMSIQVSGNIQNDGREMASISAKVSGRIEKLYVRYRYQMVKPGERVMELYSPAIVTAQQNFLFILEHDNTNTSLLESAKQRLLLMGMDSRQLQRLIKTRKVSNTISVYSNVMGHIHEAGEEKMDDTKQGRSTITEPLVIREGMYVQAGQQIFLLTNPDKAVAVLNLSPENEHLISVGKVVNIIPESKPGTTFQGTIDLVEPSYREGSKTLAALVYFDNSRLRVPVGSQVRANISGNSVPRNWLPGEAVLSLGLNEIAFVKTDRGFVAQKVVTGLQQGNLIQVVSGLAPSDSVAANAQYLRDSDSIIKINQ